MGRKDGEARRPGETRDRKVKGSFFIEYLRMVKNRRDVEWGKYLLPEDLALLEGQVSESDWFPMEIFERLGLAILQEIAEGNLATVRLWGRTMGEDMVKSHPDLVAAGDPMETLIRFQVVRRSFFNFDAVKILVFLRKYAKVEITYNLSPEAEKAAAYQTLGYFERLLELAGATNVQHRFLRRQWGDSSAALLELEWSETSAAHLVRGNLFKDYLGSIPNPEILTASRHLRAEDLKLIRGPLLEMQWYPLAAFERVVLAMFDEAAACDLDAVRGWGRSAVDRFLPFLESLIEENSPRDTLNRFLPLRHAYYNFDPVDIQGITEKSARLQIDYGMCRTAEQVVSYRLLGYFERLLEHAGAKGLNARIGSKVWEGDPVTIIELSWTLATPQKRVKGILFSDYVRMIRRHKQVDWSKYLQPEDEVFLKEKIIDTEWYPFDTFERMGIGIITEIAKGSMDAVCLWGRLQVDNLSRSYPDLLAENDPLETIMRFQVFRKAFFDFNPIEVEALYTQYARLLINFEMSALAEEAATNQTLGFFWRVLECAGAENFRFCFLAKCWEGDSDTILELRWD